jgi:queuine/archaeosine tRNA-ribosyltransferase
MKQFWAGISLLICLLMSFADSTSSQVHSKDILYLKNGSVINGMIIELVPNKSIKIKKTDGDIIVYSFDDIEKIEK